MRTAPTILLTLITLAVTARFSHTAALDTGIAAYSDRYWVILGLFTVTASVTIVAVASVFAFGVVVLGETLRSE